MTGWASINGAHRCPPWIFKGLTPQPSPNHRHGAQWPPTRRRLGRGRSTADVSRRTRSNSLKRDLNKNGAFCTSNRRDCVWRRKNTVIIIAVKKTNLFRIPLFHIPFRVNTQLHVFRTFLLLNRSTIVTRLPNCRDHNGLFFYIAKHFSKYSIVFSIEFIFLLIFILHTIDITLIVLILFRLLTLLLFFANSILILCMDYLSASVLIWFVLFMIIITL